MLTSPHVQAPPPAETRPIAFLHIPKTAGTSFLTTLRNLFGDRRVLRITGTDDARRQQVAELLQAGRPPAAVLAGHIPRHVWQPHLQGLRPFTMLRDPVERVCSLYRFLRRAQPEALAEIGLPAGFSLEQFLACRAPGTFSQLHNGMARMLSGDAALNDPEQAAFWSEAAMTETLADTQRFLAEADFGLAEHMHESLVLLQQAWAIPFRIAEYHENTTEADEPVAPADLQRIAACNTVDIALHHTARRMFFERLRGLSRTNAPDGPCVWRPALEAETGIEDIGGRQGFHDHEPIGFAWAMQRPTPQIHFLAPPDGAGRLARFELRVYNISPLYQAEDFDLHIDDTRLPCRFAARNGHWATVVTDPFRLADRPHCLSIAPAYGMAVRDLDPSSADQRHLSFALASVRLRAVTES